MSERAHGPLRPPAAPPLAPPASSASAPDETAPRDWLSLAQLILMDWQQAAGEHEGAASPAAPPPPRASAASRPSLFCGAARRNAHHFGAAPAGGGHWSGEGRAWGPLHRAIIAGADGRAGGEEKGTGGTSVDNL